MFYGVERWADWVTGGDWERPASGYGRNKSRSRKAQRREHSSDSAPGLRGGQVGARQKAQRSA